MQNWEFLSFITTEELEMDTDSLYVALAELDLHDCIRPTI